MAYVTYQPEISRKISKLVHKALNVDDSVNRWPIYKLDTYLENMAKPVQVIMPNNKALMKKLQKAPQMTFHDGQPVTLLESGGVHFMLKEDMCVESVRYQSFLKHSWPQTAPVSPSVLAKAGFFYIGVKDTVQCFSCNGRITNWTPGDTAMGEHRKFYPSCKFVRGIDSRNVPFTGLLDESSKKAGSKSDTKPGSSSAEDEAGCTEKSIEDMVQSLRLEDREIIEPSPSTASYFKNELNRLLTFKAWPISSPVDRFDLAAAGFYCVSESLGIVQCFACFGRLSNWKLGDRPKVEHRQKFPSCPFMMGHATENKPLTSSQKEHAVRYFSEGGVNVKQPMQITPGNHPSSNGPVARPLTSHDPNDLTVKYAKYPQRAYEQARLESYSEWPRNHSQIPANLARAGFFATGNEDEVKCFYCGGGLKDWDIEDDPWEEHARWFGKCEWLIQQRGPSFVEAVIRKYGKSEPYYQSVPAPAIEPAKSQETRVLPHQFTVSSIAAEPEPRSPQGRIPETRQSEPRKKETKKQTGKKKPQSEKKKQGKKREEKRRDGKSIEERVEEQLQTDMVKFMLEMGQDVAIVRSVLMKRLQSGRKPFENSEELLTAIFAEEELQKKGASNVKPAEPEPLEGQQQSTYTPLRGSHESSGSEGNDSPPSERSQNVPNHVRESDSAGQLYGQFKVKLAAQLTRDDCRKLCMVLNLMGADTDRITRSRPPVGDALLASLESRGIISMANVDPLERALLALELRRAAREVADYRRVINRVEYRPPSPGNNENSSSAGEDSTPPDFVPDEEFAEILKKFSEYIGYTNVDHLCTYFSLTPREKENILDASSPGEALVMFLYKRDIIKPDDVLFLSEALKELNLRHAAAKLDLFMESQREEEQQSNDIQSEEFEKLREKNLCKICLDNNVEMLFLPCKHLVTCSDCASQVDICPICRSTIEDKIYVYMP